MMKNYKAILFGLVFYVSALCVYAQTDYSNLEPPSPTEPALFKAESGLYRASMGTIQSDIDRFMGVGSFRDTDFKSMLLYTGFDPQGITIGAGIKLGMFYFGAAYGGSLIQDLFSRATNQDPSELSLSLDTSAGSETEVPGVSDMTGNRPVEVKNRNEFNLFLGIWRVGLKIGFSQTLSVTQPQNENESMKVGNSAQGFAFENAIVPSLALGASIPISSSLFVVPELSAQLDIHQFVKGSDPHIDSSTGLPDFYSGYTQTYSEARIGGDISVVSRSPSSELRLGGGYYLKKRINGLDMASGAEITHVVVHKTAVVDETPTSINATIVSVYDNLEQQITPYILYTGKISEQIKIGVKVLADIRLNKYSLTPNTPPGVLFDPEPSDPESSATAVNYGDYEKEASETYIKPELDFGGTFTLLPNRFALHAGFGLNLYTFNISDSTRTIFNAETGEPEKQEEKSFVETLPSSRFAVGFTVNLNANTTIDMLLITSGKFDFKNEPDYSDIAALRRSAQDNNKFTLFLTIQR